MNNLTFTMKVIETLKDLFGNGLDVGDRYSPIVGANDQFQEIVSKHFKHHADMSAVHAGHFELIQQLNAFQTIGIRWIAFAHMGQEFDFVQGGFRVMFGALHDFHRHESSYFTIPTEPNR